MDIRWFLYFANLHEYWMERLELSTDLHRATEVPICFPLHVAALRII